MKSPPQRRRLWQEVLAIAAISAIGLVYVVLQWQIGPPSIATGRIVGFDLAEHKVYDRNDSIMRVEVRLPDGRSVSVVLPDGTPCRVGSAVAIAEAHTVLGTRYTAGLRGCSPPPPSAQP